MSSGATCRSGRAHPKTRTRYKRPSAPTDDRGESRMGKEENSQDGLLFCFDQGTHMATRRLDEDELKPATKHQYAIRTRH